MPARRLILVDRPIIPFHAINRRSQPGFDPSFQKHHLLPRQAEMARGFAALFAAIGAGRIGFDDFRRNGMLLPAKDQAALRIGLPLHRGPHRTYNELVIERIGQIEAGWARLRVRDPRAARCEAEMRLALLQRALRRGLLSGGKRAFRLCRRDPEKPPNDFSELDAMAASLRPETEV